LGNDKKYIAKRAYRNSGWDYTVLKLKKEKWRTTYTPFCHDRILCGEGRIYDIVKLKRPTND
jgi:hypothetical protein